MALVHAIAAGAFWFAGGLLAGIYLTLWLLSRDQSDIEPQVRRRSDGDRWRGPF